MADSLLSPAVGTAMCAASAAAVAYAAVKVKKDEVCEKKIPIIGVMGAFVFAAQMINIAIPGTGSSGHIGGGIVLAAMIGGFPALLSLAAVLLIQCLFFADGGLLALGCNIFNLGVIPCLIVYPLLFKPLVKNNFTVARITAASMAAAVVALQLGAFAVVLETRCSGIAELPFGAFAVLMQPIHLAIGIIEGIISAAVLCFVHKMRPEIMESTFQGTAINSGVPVKKILIALGLVTLASAGALSLFVSQCPDGLEWSIQDITGSVELETDSPFVESLADIQEKTAFLPDYRFPDAAEIRPGEGGAAAGTALAGISGSILTLILAGITVLVISLVKKKRDARQGT